MIHVYPIDDLEEHLLTDTICKCDPKVISIPHVNEVIIVHNSFDGREGVEIANEILNRDEN